MRFVESDGVWEREFGNNRQRWLRDRHLRDANVCGINFCATLYDLDDGPLMDRMGMMEGLLQERRISKSEVVFFANLNENPGDK